MPKKRKRRVRNKRFRALTEVGTGGDSSGLRPRCPLTLEEVGNSPTAAVTSAIQKVGVGKICGISSRDLDLLKKEIEKKTLPFTNIR